MVTGVFNDIGYRAPAESFPRPSPGVIANNKLAAMGYLANLDGLAIVYPTEVDTLVAADGAFRAALPLAHGSGISSNSGESEALTLRPRRQLKSSVSMRPIEMVARMSVGPGRHPVLGQPTKSQKERNRPLKTCAPPPDIG
jgi:hypothetical protein